MEFDTKVKAPKQKHPKAGYVIDGKSSINVKGDVVVKIKTKVKVEMLM